MEPMPPDSGPYHAKCIAEHEPTNFQSTNNTMSEMKLAERLLRKVKLNSNGGLTVIWMERMYNPETFAKSDSTEARTSTAPAHPDMVAAMAVLKEHHMILGEEETVKGNYPFDGSIRNLEKYHISSLTLRGGIAPGEDEDAPPIGAHIYGRKKLATGLPKNFGTQSKIGVPQEQYRFNGQLGEHIARIEAEAWAYLFDGKQGEPPANPQKAIDFDNPDAGEDDPSIKAIGAAVGGDPEEAED